jgi:hypothetical protein
MSLDKINPRIVFPSFAQTFLGPSKKEKKGKMKKKVFFFLKVRAKKSAKPDKRAGNLLAHACTQGFNITNILYYYYSKIKRG